MAAPLKPQALRIFHQSTEFDLAVTYHGDLEDCVKLYEEIRPRPVTAHLSAASDEADGSIRISISSLLNRAHLSAALRQFLEIDERAIELGLTEAEDPA